MVAVGALVDQPLTSMIWLRGLRHRRGRRPAREDGGDAGIPYQQAFLKTILERANLSESDVKAVNVGLGLLPAYSSGKAQAMLGAASATSRASTCGCAARAPSSRPWTGWACPATTRSCSSPRASASRTTRSRSASSSPRSPAPPRLRSSARSRRPRRCSRRTTRSTPRPPPPRWRRRCRSCRARGEALRIHGPGALEDVHRLDAGQRDQLSAARSVRGPQQRRLPGRIPE